MSIIENKIDRILSKIKYAFTYLQHNNEQIKTKLR